MSPRSMARIWKLRIALLSITISMIAGLPLATPVNAQNIAHEGTLMLEEGRRLAADGRPADALAFYGQALDMAEVSLGSGSPALGLLLHELGTVFRDAGDLDRAEEQFRRSLAVLEKALGEHHVELLPALSDLARLVDQRNEPGEAQGLYQRLVTILKQNRAPGDSDTVAALGQLALSLDRQQRGEEAETLYREAIAEAGQHGQDSIELATVLNNLATHLYRRDELAEAEPLLRRAAALRQRLLGPQHWLVAVSLSDLARAVEKLGPREEALDLATRAAAVLSPYCGGLSAEAPGESRSAQELCRATEALRERLKSTAAIAAGPEPTPQSVGLKPERQIYRSQLMSQENLTQAQAALVRLRSQYGDLLGGHSAHLESIDLGPKGIWHRLQFGDFADHDLALTLCNQILARGWEECWVVEAEIP